MVTSESFSSTRFTLCILYLVLLVTASLLSVKKVTPVSGVSMVVAMILRNDAAAKMLLASGLYEVTYVG